MRKCQRSCECLIVTHLFGAKLCIFKISFTKIVCKFKRIRQVVCWKTSCICFNKVAQTLTQVYNLENMLYKFGPKLDLCNNKFYMQQTSLDVEQQVILEEHKVYI